MAISGCCYLLRPNFHLSPTNQVPKTIDLHSSLLYNPGFHSISKRESRMTTAAAASISWPPIDGDGMLENKLSEHGVTLSDISGSSVVKMTLENGSVAKVMLPIGLITSYKPLMWHGGTMELLHTSVSEGESGEALIHGGVSLSFTCDSNGISWSPTTWVLRQVKGNPQESIQVELLSKNTEESIEVKHIITLKEDLLSSEIIISNSNSSSLKMMGSIISHLTVSTPEATFAMGLEGSDFFSRPPISTDFSLIHPSFGKRNDRSSSNISGPMALVDFFTSWGARNQKCDDSTAGMMVEILEGEEDDNFKNLAEEMSRIYTSAPRNFTIMDRGRRNSVVVRRDGFEELYMFSPGSSHEWYGKYAYICIGQAAMLEPMSVGSHSKWKGVQHLYNPNL